MNWSHVAMIAGAESVPSPLAGEGGSESPRQEWVRGAPRPFIRTCRIGRRRCLLPQGERAHFRRLRSSRHATSSFSWTPRRDRRGNYFLLSLAHLDAAWLHALADFRFFDPARVDDDAEIVLGDRNRRQQQRLHRNLFGS